MASNWGSSCLGLTKARTAGVYHISAHPVGCLSIPIVQTSVVYERGLRLPDKHLLPSLTPARALLLQQVILRAWALVNPPLREYILKPESPPEAMKPTQLTPAFPWGSGEAARWQSGADRKIGLLPLPLTSQHRGPCPEGPECRGWPASPGIPQFRRQPRARHSKSRVAPWAP